VPERRAPPIAPKDLARRSATFAMVALLDPLAALGFAFAIEMLALAAGMAEANALALALFAMPLAWLALATWQMIRSDWRARLLPALVLALSGILTLVTLFHA
ncbi:hypothetical protein MTR62_18655, partial [Novosphingobium sp. 1949]|nr:hypothetical protein [Novosphingobium organovorum]